MTTNRIFSLLLTALFAVALVACSSAPSEAAHKHSVHHKHHKAHHKHPHRKHHKPKAVVKAPVKTVGVLGDSITYGWGTTDYATKSFPALAHLPSTGEPGSCLFTDDCWWDPTISSFSSRVAALHTDIVIVEVGTNDLPYNPTLDQYIAGYQNLLAQAKTLGVTLRFTTIAPRNDAPFPLRLAVNDYLRTLPGTIDFAASLSTPTGDLRPEFDSGDGLHPNDAGARALANCLLAAI